MRPLKKIFQRFLPCKRWQDSRVVKQQDHLSSDPIWVQASLPMQMLMHLKNNEISTSFVDGFRLSFTSNEMNGATSCYVNNTCKTSYNVS